MSNKKKKDSRPKHISDRREHDKIYGKDDNWTVFKHNLYKLVCVDMISRSFIVLVGSLAFTIFFLADQVYVTKNTVEWTELLVAIGPPSFFAFYWIERKLAGEILRAFILAVGEFFKRK